ncbi:MAG: hypothetical protein ACQCN6_14110 [Candidatus Bathyarchaeia archaeon]|jgi:hypothetical protein
MRTELKYFLAAFLSISSGIAFAYPLYYVGYVEPLNRVPEGPKPDLKLDLVYANFTLQPSNSNLPIPTWYDTSRDGQPDFLMFDMVVNVTNYSNRTALINQLSLCACNSTVSFLSIFQNCTSSKGTVEGVWLDGKWLNVSWVPSSNGVQGHWREGVTIERSFVNGTLTSVSMDINGSWVDVTDRVRLLEKHTIMPMSECPVLTDIIGSGEIRFFNPRHWQPSAEMPLYSVTNVNLDDGFNNHWEVGQSRLLMLRGVLPISSTSLPDLVERLNSNITLVHIQADTEFQDPTFNGVHTNTHNLENVLDTINLTTEENCRIYNNVLASNQVFELDSYGVEAFIEPRS